MADDARCVVRLRVLDAPVAREFLDVFLSIFLTGSSGEAAFMTGLERNSDIVFAASYAPLLQVS